ncbi:hypothetical protein LTR37_012125 [Vermiconidia calcicola]|uniref:Uncharacterized protein n=1 Tax=Vermiconidia calcicola TaxID=1690605 RepID=A0ACC3N1I1_9PEZI|nr:hypothetical protein LTR37_012125 [Vermiconidia calcicola]
MSGKTSFGEKMGDWFRHILSCCDREQEEEERPALQISGPTNFRREDISIPGLDPEQQRFIREKAISDAHKMWDHLQPLRSSPSSHFATPPSYEQFTTPRSPTSPRTYESPLERVKRHSRKISNTLRTSSGGGQYHGVPGGGDGKYEMRALMDPSRAVSREASEGNMQPGKESGESFSASGSERDGVVMMDRDSGKGMIKV